MSRSDLLIEAMRTTGDEGPVRHMSPAWLVEGPDFARVKGPATAETATHVYVVVVDGEEERVTAQPLEDES